MVLRRSVMWTILGALGLSLLGTSTAFACQTSSWITTDPSSGPPGTKITITGDGFEPGTVMFRWDRSAESGGEVLGQATVGDDGSLVTEVTVPEAAAGAHKVIAEHTSSSESVAHADAWTDFYIPGAPAESGSESGAEAGSEEKTGQVPERSRPGHSMERSERAEPAARPVEVAIAQPLAEEVPAQRSERADEAVDISSRSGERVSQLAWQLRAVDTATEPVMTESIDRSAEAPSSVPAEREALGWDVRWAAALVVAMMGGLLLLNRRKQRSPEPEAPVVAISKAHSEEEAETSRAA